MRGGYRFSEEIMLKQNNKAESLFDEE